MPHRRSERRRSVGEKYATCLDSRLDAHCFHLLPERSWLMETTRWPTSRGSSESTKGEAPGGASRDGSERCSIGISGTEMLEEVSWRRAESVGARSGDATGLDLGLYFHDRFSLIKIRVEAQSPTSTPPAFRVVLIRIGFTSFQERDSQSASQDQSLIRTPPALTVVLTRMELTSFSFRPFRLRGPILGVGEQAPDHPLG